MLVVAALLLTSLTGTAAAADYPEHLSKNAQKILSVLNSVGINDPSIREFIATANSHVENGYLNLDKENAMGGTLALRYPLSAPDSPDGFFKSRRLELNYTPQDSHVTVTARPDGVIIRYRLKW